MISNRIAAAIGAAVLASGIVVGSAGAVLLGRAGNPTDRDWGQMHQATSGYGMMGGGGTTGGYGMMGGAGMMGGSPSFSDMRDLMRDHMGLGSNSR